MKMLTIKERKKRLAKSTVPTSQVVSSVTDVMTLLNYKYLMLFSYSLKQET